MRKHGILREDRDFEKIKEKFFLKSQKMLTDERNVLQRAYKDKAGTIYFYYLP